MTTHSLRSRIVWPLIAALALAVVVVSMQVQPCGLLYITALDPARKLYVVRA